MPLPPFAHFPAAGPYGPMNPMLALATANGLYGHGGHGGGGGPHPRGGHPGGRGGGGGNMRGGMQRGFDNASWGEEFTKLSAYPYWLELVQIGVLMTRESGFAINKIWVFCLNNPGDYRFFGSFYDFLYCSLKEP